MQRQYYFCCFKFVNCPIVNAEIYCIVVKIYFKIFLIDICMYVSSIAVVVLLRKFRKNSTLYEYISQYRNFTFLFHLIRKHFCSQESHYPFVIIITNATTITTFALACVGDIGLLCRFTQLALLKAYKLLSSLIDFNWNFLNFRILFVLSCACSFIHFSLFPIMINCRLHSAAAPALKLPC